MPSPVDPFWQTGTFAGALTDPDLGEPGYLAAHHGGRTAQRFNVYRNNVVHSLVEALATSELAVETAVTLRNKVVEAYQEILRMPV